MRKHLMRKTTAILLCGTLLCGMSACGKKEVTLDSGAAANEIAEQTVVNASEIANFSLPEKGEPIVVLTIRNYGDVKIRLFPDKTEKGAENFRKLAESGFYDDLIFHRVVDGFVIQGGDPKGNGTGGVDAWGSEQGFAQTISPDLCHVTGAVAYAIGSDKLNKSQFYIVTGTIPTAEEFALYREKGYSFSPEAEALYKQVGGVPYLDGGYEVFGQVFDGMEYVLEIQKAAVDANSKPKKQIVIEKAVVTEYDGTPPAWLNAEGKPFTPAAN
ncbi:MAG: peptidylprolyl isomerase [Oscillospiraceae bacterium]|nr:peptidylprolyl isomerase [Oscillospiraceae bacterium]